MTTDRYIQCAGTDADGSRCWHRAMPDDTLCARHALEEQRAFLAGLVEPQCLMCNDTGVEGGEPCDYYDTDIMDDGARG